ncbi:MFS transporter [Reticulibacter mediterranei]|uniref:MFS transporter n=1 Tax=Reticulibacter mediterranei TaxID=2778369 RepID=A0A8J3III3_9CHLR|nr:MFS transporter [Reticulibacter mediterranei]GHO94263.1 MFS transporter [Reticulibacter mediterranei]
MHVPEKPVPSRRWWSLLVILAGTFMGTLDMFVVNVGILSIQQSLHSTFAQVELVIAGYTLCYAVLLITGGRLGDLYGRKRLFQLGILSFTLTSLLCGLAPNATMLIVFRLVQGCSAALMIPQVIALIQVTFAGTQRAIALGCYGATLGLASITGQIVGGLLIGSNVFDFGWRSIFFINVPVGVLTLLASIPLVREFSRRSSRHLDLLGVGILTIGLFLLAYPLIEGHDLGWPLWTFLSLLFSVPVLALFVFYEYSLTRRGGSPLVPLALFRQRNFVLGMLTALVFYSANGALFFTLALYLQFGLGFSPLVAGLTYLPMGLGFFFTSLLVPRVVSLIGGKWVLRSGAMVMGIGELWIITAVLQAGMRISQNQLLLPLLVFGLGGGMIGAPLMNVVLSDIPSQDAGAASGLLTTAVQLSSAIGVAVIGVIFFGVLGPTTPGQIASLSALPYGQAFVASVSALVALAIATLLSVSLLRSPKKGQGDTAREQVSVPSLQKVAPR